MKKIKYASCLLSIFFQSLCWLAPLATGYLILFRLKDIMKWGFFALIPPVEINNLQFSFTHCFVIFAIQCLPLSITILICQRLSKLFQLYGKGHLFEETNIRLIKQISLFMIAGEAMQLIYQPLITAALTFANPPGERVASLTLGTTNASTLITAFIILLASWIIQEANQLKSDSQLTI